MGYEQILFAKKMNLFAIATHHGAEMLPAVSEERLARFETDNNLKLPRPLREFYLEAGGTGDFTEWSWRIWPFEELVTIESRAGSNPDLVCLRGNPLFPFPDRLSSVFSALGEKANS